METTAGGQCLAPSVQVFSVFRAKMEKNEATFIAIILPKKKRQGAWMDDARTTRRLESGDLETTIAFVTCNFLPPTEKKPALLLHSEVETLFHEFGHALHHVLSQVACAAVSGISGVEWDRGRMS